MANMTIFLDGITLQHAGELLFDSKVNSGNRMQSRDTYIRCLEDFAFGLVYSDNFSVTSTLPRVGDESPGAILTAEFNDKYVGIKVDKKIQPETIILWPEVRKRAILDLQVLDLALQRQRSYWNHFLIRETESYLGDDASLFSKSDDPDAFVFSREPPYLVDRELQSAIPSRFIDELAAIVKVHLSLLNINENALKEFVSRIALTHVIIFLWYDIVAYKQLMVGGMRLPHVTRSLIRTVQKSTGHNSLLGDTIETLSRHTLFDATLSSTTREDVVKRLHDLSSMRPYPGIRKLLKETVETLSNESDGKKRQRYAQSLRNEIRSLALQGQGKQDNVDFQLKIGAPLGLGDISVSGIKNIDVKDIFSSQRRALRTFFRHNQISSSEDYLRSLSIVFPELGIK